MFPSKFVDMALQTEPETQVGDGSSASVSCMCALALTPSPPLTQVPLLWEMHAVDQDNHARVDRTTAGNKVSVWTISDLKLLSV